MLLAQTGEMKNFENELAQSLGPDEAHRVAYDDALGSCGSVISNGPGAKLPPGSRRDTGTDGPHR